MIERKYKESLQDYFKRNFDAICRRLKFLDKKAEDLSDFISPLDIIFCFEEAKHCFMMGDFTASIAMCAITIERWLAHILELPYYAPVDEESSEKDTLGKLNKKAYDIQMINRKTYNEVLLLKNLRTEHFHGIDPQTHKRPKNKKRHLKFSIENPQELGADISSLEKDAKKAIGILFNFYRKNSPYQTLK
jgi:hypothetical protein